MTFGTGLDGKKLVCPFLTRGRVVAVDDILKVFDHTIIIGKEITRGVHQFLADAHTLKPAIENLVESLVGYILDRGLEGTLIIGQYGFYLPEYHGILVLAQWDNGSIVYAFVAIGDDLVEVYLVYIAQTLASLACTLGRIE